MTLGFGKKWKSFFQDLELYDRLNTDSDAHIWLLHHCFLSAINQDALEWAETWNAHRLSIRGERQRSPRDMFLFGMIQNGPRGLAGIPEPELEEVIEAGVAGYGIDWEALDDEQVRIHHDIANPNERFADNPFITHEPEHLSNIEVHEPNCPLSPEQLDHLDSQLNTIHSHTMEGYRLQWVIGLRICQEMFGQ